MKIEDVKDPVFSQKMMGDGYAVFPKDGVITSPVAGKVVTIFPTKHAIGIMSNNGDEVILHIGINTVDLNGKPFEIYVKENQKISESTKLVEMDLSMLEKLKIDPSVIVVITNLKDNARIDICGQDSVKYGDKIGKIKCEG